MTDMSAEKRCHGCYDSLSGPWCDNCDQWPCLCMAEKQSAEYLSFSDEPQPTLWGEPEDD